MTDRINDFVSYIKENYPMVKLEDTVYDFPLNLYNPVTDELEEKMIADYQGRRLVLFFYPADFTFVCPTELKDLQKVYDDFAALENVDVLVGSTDSVFTHRAWVQKEGLVKDLKYPMFADRDTVMSKYFGILNHDSGHAERGTFIISPEGVLKSVEIHTEPLGRSAKELLRKVKGLKFISDNPGNACVASWEDASSPTLQPSLKITGEVESALN